MGEAGQLATISDMGTMTDITATVTTPTTVITATTMIMDRTLSLQIAKAPMPATALSVTGHMIQPPGPISGMMAGDIHANRIEKTAAQFEPLLFLRLSKRS